MRNSSSALLQRNMARKVRHMASLISGHDKIRERQGEGWAADLNQRIIYWRANHPYKPEEVLSDDQVLWLTIHEAAHLVKSSVWEMPEPPIIDSKKRFHRFWNAVEDIRIERWALERFPGKAHTCKEMRLDFHAALVEAVPDINKASMHMADQVGLNWINLEYDIPIYGDSASKKFTKKYWGEIQDIVATSSTSNEVAKRILPIYQKIMEEAPPCESDDEEEGDVILTMDEDGEGFSDGKGITISFEDLLKGMARDASSGETKRRLIIKIQNEQQAQRMAEALALQGIGLEASGIEGHSDDWNRSKLDNRGPISVLSRRLQSRLSHNESDAWDLRLKRGQFDSGAAHRSLRGNMRVFRKKHAIGRADYDFCITVDMSGSQGGRERELLASCVVASEAIERAGMGLSLITWDGAMRHWKNWHSSIKSAQGIIGYDLAHAGGGTYEGYALRVAEDLIRPRLALGRQVFLITLTDGDTSAVNESQEIMRDLEARGVMTIGVGVMHSAPQHYSTKISVQTGEELATVLPNLLRNLIKRG